MTEAVNSHCLEILAQGAEEACYLWKDMVISNIEEGRALNSWLIGLCF